MTTTPNIDHHFIVGTRGGGATWQQTILVRVIGLHLLLLLQKGRRLHA